MFVLIYPHNVSLFLGYTSVFQVSRRAVFLFDVDTSHVSFDTTSMSVYGECEQYCEGASVDAPFIIAHGYSKDHRPDLKQFLVSMLCVDRNIPILGGTEDGNASDKTINNAVLSSVSKHLAKFGIAEGAYIYIADSAVVTEENLKQMGDSILFITRLPATYNECARVVREAFEKDEWEDFGVLAETKPTKNRPAVHYKSHESEVELYGKKYRSIVVHFSAHDKRRKKRIDRELETDRKEIESELKKLSNERFYCFEDAEKSMQSLLGAKSKYHAVEANVVETPKYKRGRPRNGEKQIDRIFKGPRDRQQYFFEEAGKKRGARAGLFAFAADLKVAGARDAQLHRKDRFNKVNAFFFIDKIFKGHGLRIQYAGSLALNQPMIVIICDFLGTFFSTYAAGDTFFHVDISGRCLTETVKSPLVPETD